MFAAEDATKWIRKWGGVGFGLMGGQGAESIHAEFNRIEVRHRNQRHDPVERLRRVVTDHLLKSLPSHVAALPPTKRRRRLSYISLGNSHNKSRTWPFGLTMFRAPLSRSRKKSK